MSQPFTFNMTELESVARSWVGTPFHANSNERGPRGGVCCHLLVAEIYKACGFVIENVPMGIPGHARFNIESIIEPFLDKSEQFARITEEPKPGELLGFRVGKTTIHHVAILLPNSQIVHAVAGAGVLISPYADPTWKKRHAATWRPLS